LGRREDKRELTRQQLLDAAAILFAERGYESTSIEDVAEKANVSKGTFYYHFDSKEALVIALRSSFVADTIDEAFRNLANGHSALTVLEKLLLDTASFTEKEPELSKVFYEQRVQQFFFHEEAVEVLETGQRRNFRTAIYELICEAQKCSQIRADVSPQELVGMIGACFLHAQGAWLSSRRSGSLVEQVHRWIHVMLDGMGSKAYRDQVICPLTLQQR